MAEHEKEQNFVMSTCSKLRRAAALVLVLGPTPVERRCVADGLPTLVRPLTEKDWARLAPHPRLLGDRRRFDTLAKDIETDPTLRGMADLLKRQADAVVAAAPVSFEDRGSFQVDAMRTLQGRILSTAMAFRLTGERRYFDAARRELLVLSARPDWNPKHFLDVGEASLAAGVGLDWLYDDLSPADRDTIAAAIVANGLRTALEVPERGSWVSADYNWNPVCNGGLTVAALAVADREPDLARRTVDRAVANLPAAAALYAPDGTYAEGPSYWSYGTTFYAVTVSALRSALGTSCDLEKLPGVLASGDFVTQMRGPTGEDFNFADYYPRRSPEPVMVWLARERRRADYLIPERDAITALNGQTLPESAALDGLSRMLAFEMLWWDSSLPPAAHAPLPTAWVAGGSVPVGVFRSGWDDPRATFVAVKGGTCNGSHGHMDVGSFVLEAAGVRWAVDPGAQEYKIMRAAKIDLWNYTQDSSRWSVFRCGPEAHNILRFDGARQVADARADVKPLEDTADGRGGRVDLSAIYAGQARDVSRKVRLHADGSVSVIDEWTTGPRAVEAAWQWLTRAKVEVTPTGFTLRQNNERLDVTVNGPAGLAIGVEDVSAPRAPQDSANPGLNRVVVRMTTPANARAVLTVHATPARD